MVYIAHAGAHTRRLKPLGSNTAPRRRPSFLPWRSLRRYKVAGFQVLDCNSQKAMRRQAYPEA